MAFKFNTYVFFHVVSCIYSKSIQEDDAGSGLVFDERAQSVRIPYLTVPWLFYVIVVIYMSMRFMLHVFFSMLDIIFVRSAQAGDEPEAMQDKYNPLRGVPIEERRT